MLDVPWSDDCKSMAYIVLQIIVDEKGHVKAVEYLKRRWINR